MAATLKTKYENWDRFTRDECARVDEEGAKEAEAADRDLGLDKAKSQPKSDVEAREMAKREALVEEKKRQDAQRKQEKDRMVHVEGETDATVDLGEVLAAHAAKHAHIKTGQVLVIKRATRCRYVLPRNTPTLIKVFVSECEDTELEVHARIITQHMEIAHCTSCKFRIGIALNTVQVDLSHNVELKYLDAEVFAGQEHSVVHAGVTDSTVIVGEERLAVDYKADGAEAVGERSPEEFQFITKHRAGALRTMRGERIGPVLSSADDCKANTEIKAEERARLERAALQSKVGGNEAFAESNFAQAAVFYTKAIQEAPLETDGVTPSPIVPVCLSNRAACWLKLGQPEKALDDADACLRLEPKHVKGNFRRGMALHALGRWREAIPALETAQSLQPKNKQIEEAIKFAEFKARKAMSSA